MFKIGKGTLVHILERFANKKLALRKSNAGGPLVMANDTYMVVANRQSDGSYKYLGGSKKDLKNFFQNH